MKRKRKPNLPAENRDAVMLQIADLLRAGKTKTEILDAIPVKSSRLITETRRMIGMGQRSEKVVLSDRKIAEMHSQGMRVQQIADAINRPVPSVCKAMRRMGIEATQEVRPITIVGIGSTAMPSVMLRKLRQVYPEIAWTLARVIPEKD
jgi:hypothetical protein